MGSKIYEIKNIGFLNKGAELMFLAIIKELFNIDSSARLTLQQGKSTSMQKRIQYHALRKIGGMKRGIDFGRISMWIPSILKNAFHLATDKDLAGIFDASGFAYGGGWRPSMLIHASKQARKMKFQGGFFILMPQAFGSFDTSEKKNRIRELVDAADIVFARDKESWLNLEKAGVNQKNIKLFPDFTATVPASETMLPKSDYACIVPNIKLLSRMNPKKESRSSYLKFIFNCVQYLRRNDILPFFVLHHLKDDKQVVDAVNVDLKNKVDTLYEENPRKIKYILGHSRLNICSRYHACVSSLSQGIPALATSWSHKYEMLYEDFGVPQLIIDNYDKPEGAIDSVLSNHLLLSDVLNKSTSQIYTKIAQMWELIADCIRSKNG